MTLLRCKPEFELAMKEDLKWLGIDWEDPIRRQSEHFLDYEQAFLKVKGNGISISLCVESIGNKSVSISNNQSRKVGH